MDPETRTKEAFIGVLRAERSVVEALVEQVAPERRASPGALDAWSVKDLIAHFLLWERWILDRGEELLHAGQVTEDERDTRPTDEMNDLHFLRYQHVSYEDVCAEEDRIFGALLKLVGDFDEAALFDPARFDFSPGVALADEVWNETVGHYRSHRDDLAAFLRL